MAQAGWVALLIAETSIGVTFVWVAVLLLVELAGPVLAERLHGGTPWHPHHIAERHGLLVIIALGEGLLGTAFALGVLVGPEGPGWSVDVVVLGLAGTALTFGMWWIYFILPMGGLLERHRERSFGWGYGHIPLFGALAAVGAGLHAAAYYLEHHSVLGTTGTVLTVAVPVGVRRPGLRPLLPADPDLRPVPPAPAGRHRGRRRRIRRHGGGRGPDGLVPGCSRADALGDRRGLRDRRLPPRRGSLDRI